MSISVNRLALAVLLAGACTLPLGAQKAAEPAVPPEAVAIKGLQWRSIGPANPGGRVADIVGIPGDPAIFYVVPANAGIFKTLNGGTTFTQIFADDNIAIASVGALAIAPSDPNVLWAGTGEGDPRNSTSYGDGIYRSTDGGATWAHLGLVDTERIKRIRVHPSEPDTAYVCALGHAWGPNAERGVFKTADGGKTWTKVLYKNPDTGCSDIDMDPSNPRILYAGMYTFRRKPWRFDSGGGETALYRSTDGGQTWTKLTNGLPKGDMDRIGVAVAPSRPETVYMVTEAKGENGGELFRSDDRGDTWRVVNDDPNINFRPFYYSDLRVDPNDPERVYSLSGSLNLSTDGGRTFARIAANVHGDHQALWIDPKNSKRVLSGSDGGFQVSMDGSRTWDIVNNIAISQFYHVEYDMRTPYTICGGLQDNGTWCGPSATSYTEGIRKDDWYTVGGGDGFFGVQDAEDPAYVYSDLQGGSISLLNVETGLSRAINPYSKEVGSTGGPIAGYKYRFNWNSPIVRSPHDPKTVYFGGNVLFKTTNRGQSWEVISPDLTTNDKSKQQSSGGPVVTDNTAAEFHCTILTIAESPVKAGVIWVGTDDGNIQVTQDGGRTWKNVVWNLTKGTGLPANAWVPTIEASHFDAGTAYVAVDRHRDDDFAPYAFKTTDFGQTWTAIKGNLPPKGYVHVVREDPKNRTLLFLGTEEGIYASWDGGGRWVSIRNNLPPVAVRDLKVHPRDNDLIIGTHSRGAWILDDIAPLQQLAEALSSDVHLFDIRNAVRTSPWGRDSNLGNRVFQAQNPALGAYVDYYLTSAPQGDVTIAIADKSGKTIRTIRNAPKQPGVNRYVWNLRYDAPPNAGAFGSGGAGAPRGGAGRQSALANPFAGMSEEEAAAAMARFGRFAGGPAVLPGEYTVTVSAGGRQLSKPVTVTLDPRIKVSEAELAEQLDTLNRLRDLSQRLNAAIERVDDLSRQLTSMQERLRPGPRRMTTSAEGDAQQTPAHGPSQPAGTPAGASDPAALIGKALEQLKGYKLDYTRACTMNYRCPGRLREQIQALSGEINRYIGAPTEGQKLRVREVTDETEQALVRLNGIITGPVAEINSTLASTPHIIAQPVK
jgi:photosystem II stability/assembly factor-like uncharacterized protein